MIIQTKRGNKPKEKHKRTFFEQEKRNKSLKKFNQNVGKEAILVEKRLRNSAALAKEKIVK